MKRKVIALIWVLSLIIGNVAAYAGDHVYATVALAEIEKSLPQESVSVGFDVDDTVLFSSPGFHYAFTNTDGPNKTNKYGDRPLSSDKFWSDMSCYLDKYSIPKESARRVIEMHKKRGDKVYFITARPEVKNEILTEILHRLFALENQPKAIFSGRTSKAEFITRHRISLFYGDSDSDISEAHDAGIRAIRFMRSPLSNNKTKYNPGKYGEAVLENSEN